VYGGPVLPGKGETRGQEWPNLFVVGAPKAGTTSLWGYLHAHPDIFMSPMKEPGYFASVPYLPSVDDAEIYLGLFSAARGERFRGEATPAYLAPVHVPEAIRRVSPDARIVISLREPVDSSRSAFYFMAQLLPDLESRTFRQAIREELDGRNRPDLPRYVWSAMYTAAVGRYLEVFGERVFVLFFDDLVADTRGVVRRLFESLDLDPTPADRFNPTPRNQFALPRNRIAGRLARSRTAGRLARSIVPRSWRDPVWRALMPPAEKPQPDPETVELLRETFEPDVVALRDLLGRRLPEAWERRFPSAAASPAEA
jgi:sulfotransferase family protein